MKKDLFVALDRFDESKELGEDLDLILKAKKHRKPITHVQAKITSSSRKYVRNGWLKTTLSHIWFTVRALLLSLG